VSASKDVLKRTVAHFAGQEMTEDQRDYARRAGGLDQAFYINQVVALIESNSLDMSRKNVRASLEKLKVAVRALRIAA